MNKIPKRVFVIGGIICALIAALPWLRIAVPLALNIYFPGDTEAEDVFEAKKQSFDKAAETALSELRGEEEIICTPNGDEGWLIEGADRNEDAFADLSKYKKQVSIDKNVLDDTGKLLYDLENIRVRDGYVLFDYSYEDYLIYAGEKKLKDFFKAQPYGMEASDFRKWDFGGGWYYISRPIR